MECMRNKNVANTLCIAGMLSIVAGAWILSPAAGLMAAGVFAVIVGIGIVRSRDDR